MISGTIVQKSVPQKCLKNGPKKTQEMLKKMLQKMSQKISQKRSEKMLLLT